MDIVFKALADPNRRRLLDQLHHQQGQTLNELCRILTMSRQAVSKHLALLEAANLVVVLRAGRSKRHYLNPVPIRHIHDRWITKFQDPALDALTWLVGHAGRPQAKERDNE